MQPVSIPREGKRHTAPWPERSQPNRLQLKTKDDTRRIRICVSNAQALLLRLPDTLARRPADRRPKCACARRVFVDLLV